MKVTSVEKVIPLDNICVNKDVLCYVFHLITANGLVLRFVRLKNRRFFGCSKSLVKS